MQHKIFRFNPLQVNTTVLWSGNRAIIFDPACSNDNERAELKSFLTGNNILHIDILLTHAHFDHIMGVNYILSEYGYKLRMHKDDLFLLESSVSMSGRFGIHMQEVKSPNEFIDENSQLHLDNESVKAIHVPGHSPGSLCYFIPKIDLLIAGDVLFKGSIGRTDLPGGNMNLLVGGIKNKLFTLTENVEVICGHGPSTTIGDELRNNPFTQ
ncbi:MAG: MBL fold metallo-hydrolase [Bacteroidales bacterium]